MGTAIIISVFVVLLFMLVLDLLGNRISRSFPKHKLTHHKQ